MSSVPFAVVKIADKKYGLPLSAIKTIESSDKANGSDQSVTLNILGQSYPVKHLESEVSEGRELILVLNSEQALAIFVDSFQSLELDAEHFYHLPNIMQAEDSFIHKLFHNPISKEIIFLCEEENFYNYLGEDNEH